MAKVESDEKILFNLLKQQKDIEATIIKAIETIVAQKRTIKLKVKKSLRVCYKDLQKVKFINFSCVLQILKDCDELVPDINTMALSLIKHNHQAKDINFNKKIQSIVDSETDHVYLRLKSYNDAFFKKTDLESQTLIQELRKFVVHDKNEDDLPVQIEKLKLQNDKYFSMIGELTKVYF